MNHINEDCNKFLPENLPLKYVPQVYKTRGWREHKKMNVKIDVIEELRRCQRSRSVFDKIRIQNYITYYYPYAVIKILADILDGIYAIVFLCYSACYLLFKHHTIGRLNLPKPPF